MGFYEQVYPPSLQPIAYITVWHIRPCPVTCMSNPVSCICSVIKRKRRGEDPSIPTPVLAHSPEAACGGGQSDLAFSLRGQHVGFEEPLGQTVPSPLSSSLCHCHIHFKVSVCVLAERGKTFHIYTRLRHSLFIVWGRMSLQLQGRERVSRGWR